MNNTQFIENIWWFLYNNLLVGRVSMFMSLALLIVAVFMFIRWKMFGMSMAFLTLALTIAYLGGFLKMIEGGI